jgi:hypothetical protein
MTTVASNDTVATQERSTNPRANALADRLEQGARALAAFASGLSDEQWQTRVPKDGRKVGVTVHHVASVLIEIQPRAVLAGGIRSRRAWDASTMKPGTPKRTTPSRKRRRWICSSATARQPRRQSALSDEALDRAAPASLYSEAPITCQFMLEDHAVRHSYHHLARLRAALNT